LTHKPLRTNQNNTPKKPPIFISTQNQKKKQKMHFYVDVTPKIENPDACTCKLTKRRKPNKNKKHVHVN